MSERVARRAEFIEMRPGVSWAIGSDLWVFPGGGQLAVGAQTDLDAAPRRNRRGGLELLRETAEHDLELVRADAEEAA